MKKKLIISLLTASVMLYTGASASDKSYFAENESRITLNANGGYIGAGHIGTETEMYVITKKGKIELPLPYRTSDYDFEGWYTEDGCKVSSDTVYDHDTTIFAKWNVIGSRVITFASDGGTHIPAITVKYGEIASIDQYIPKKQGCVFEGWYLDPQTKKIKVTELTLTENATVYARWKPITKIQSVIDKDTVYMTDEELANLRDIRKNQYKSKLTKTQIIQLIEMLRNMLIEMK